MPSPTLTDNLNWHRDQGHLILTIYEDVCPICGDSYSTYLVLKENVKQTLLGRYFPVKVSMTCCIDCLKTYEESFVSTLTAEELPLYISHRWISWVSQQIYKARLETLT